MKTWEEIIKDKLGEREITLPDESIAEFHAKLDGMAGAPAKRPVFPVWVAVAVAACLAAIVILRHPNEPQQGSQTAMQPLATVAIVTDSTMVSEPEQSTPFIAKAVRPKAVRQSYVEPQGQSVDVEPETCEYSPEEAKDTSATKTVEASPVTVIPPFVPESAPREVATMKVGSAAGIVAGSGLLAAVVTSFAGGVNNGDVFVPIDGVYQGPPKYEYLEEASHSLPLKTGLSFRIPIAGRLSLTTGLEYSLYSSKFTYRIPADAGSGLPADLLGQSVEKTQHAHYLGIPLRLDWTLASNRWLDVYVGGGFEADYCVRAVLDGTKVDKDGFGISLLGAGGIQMNLTKSIGLYVEPELIWAIASESHVLYTYRSEHPLMFSLASGVRISLGK